jgi:hypothetical protein
MSDRQPRQDRLPRRRFAPNMNPLESRALMSIGSHGHWLEP